MNMMQTIKIEVVMEVGKLAIRRAELCASLPSFHAMINCLGEIDIFYFFPGAK
jgi:hypothetical protein